MANSLSVAWAEDAFRFRLDFADPDAVPDDVAKLSESLAVFLRDRGVDDEEANALHIAIEELMTNIGKFGLLDSPPADGILFAEGAVAVDPASVSLTLSDNAPAFDPTAWPPPDLAPEALLNNPVGGLGIFMLFQMFNEVAYRRDEDRNITVWQKKRVAP